jgi:hypothetical protein
MSKGNVYKPIILEIIHKAAVIGLHLVTVKSDMGNANRAMRSSFGICASKSNRVNKIIHPDQPNKRLYFIAHPPHLIKNVKSVFISGQDFRLSVKMGVLFL